MLDSGVHKATERNKYLTPGSQQPLPGAHKARQHELRTHIATALGSHMVAAKDRPASSHAPHRCARVCKGGKLPDNNVSPCWWFYLSSRLACGM